MHILIDHEKHGESAIDYFGITEKQLLWHLSRCIELGTLSPKDLPIQNEMKRQGKFTCIEDDSTLMSLLESQGLLQMTGSKPPSNRTFMHHIARNGPAFMMYNAAQEGVTNHLQFDQTL